MNDIKNIDLDGKANSLIRLKKLDLPVPEFFVLPASYLKKIVENNGILEVVDQLLVHKKYEEIRKKVMEVSFPEAMKNDIFLKVKGLNCDNFSVRSSANNEDGMEKSFAGQYETYLNVNINNLLASIKKMLAFCVAG